MLVEVTVLWMFGGWFQAVIKKEHSYKPHLFIIFKRELLRSFVKRLVLSNCAKAPKGISTFSFTERMNPPIPTSLGMLSQFVRTHLCFSRQIIPWCSENISNCIAGRVGLVSQATQVQSWWLCEMCRVCTISLGDFPPFAPVFSRTIERLTLKSIDLELVDFHS